MKINLRFAVSICLLVFRLALSFIAARTLYSLAARDNKFITNERITVEYNVRAANPNLRFVPW